MILFRLCVLVVIATSARCAKILGVFYTPGVSHYIAGSTLMKILAERGHEVTVLSPFNEKNPPSNYNDIYLDGVMKHSTNRRINHFEDKKGPFGILWNANTFSAALLNRIMAHPKFQQLIKSNETFDAVIVEQFVCDALLYLAPHFNAPLIGFSTLDASSWTNRYVGNPTFPSYIPHVLFGFHKMTFWQRMKNTLLFLMEEIIFHIKVVPTQNKILQANIPGAPDVTEFIFNTSITFLNADLSVHDPIPKVPSMIDIGGFHIRPPKSLPTDLQEILDNAKHGVIYFSMGASVKSRDMPSEQLTVMLAVFSQLKETILWKWEDEELPGKPKNVITRKWLPQQDILGHKNVKLFITHGGLLSVMESIYHGVPMLTIPIKVDQYSNAARAEAGGYSISVEFSQLSTSLLHSTIRELLQNEEYRHNVKRRSNLMKSKPITARETIVFWVENVIRNQGLPHLRVASLDMPWYQYMLLDIIVFALTVVIISISILFYVIKYFIKVYKDRQINRKF